MMEVRWYSCHSIIQDIGDDGGRPAIWIKSLASASGTADPVILRAVTNCAFSKKRKAQFVTRGVYIDRLFTSGIILVRKRPTSSMVEQMTLNHLVQGSSPWSVTKSNLQMKVAFYFVLFGGCPSL